MQAPSIQQEISVMTQEEMKMLGRGVDALESIRAQLADMQTRIDMLFFMTEKHQQAVRDLLNGMQR
jgi:flagellar biosynthesis regulator FlaF